MSKLKSTHELKKVRDTHRFEMEENMLEVVPIGREMELVESNIKSLNEDILQTYLSKVQLSEQIGSLQERAALLADILQSNKRKSSIARQNYLRFVESLSIVHSNYHKDRKLKTKLKALSEGVDYEPNQEYEAGKRENEGLLREKLLIKKRIDEEEKKEAGLIKSQGDIAHFHGHTVQLVCEHNSLRKERDQLQK